MEPASHEHGNEEFRGQRRLQGSAATGLGIGSEDFEWASFLLVFGYLLWGFVVLNSGVCGGLQSRVERSFGTLAIGRPTQSGRLISSQCYFF